MRKWSVLVLCVVCACAKNETADPAASAGKAKESALASPSPSPSPASVEHDAGPHAAAATDAPAAAGSAATPQADAAAGVATSADGEWTHFSLNNEVPLCVLADYGQYDKAPFLKDVKRTVKTRAHLPLVFAVYGLGCAGPECVKRAGMQCWAEVDGQSITVQSRYHGEQRVGVTCTKDCESVMAACDTPNLLPGTYTLHYGDTTTTIKVPGTLRPACIRTK